MAYHYEIALDVLNAKKRAMDAFLENPYWAIENEDPKDVAAKLMTAHYFGAIHVDEVRPKYERHKRDTLLSFAAKCGKVEVVAALLAMGADPNIKDAEGRTAATSMCTRLPNPLSGHKIYHDLSPTLGAPVIREYGECQSIGFLPYRQLMEIFTRQ